MSSIIRGFITGLIICRILIEGDKEKKIYKDKNASLQFEKQKLYRALLNREKEIERLNNTLKDIKDYVNFLVIYNQTINGKFSETQWGQDLLDLIGSDKE